MKNLFCFMILILSSFTSFAQITHSEKFLLNDYTIKDTIGVDQLTYSIIQTANTGMTYKPGTPLLPMRPLKFIIPFGARIDSISVITIEKVDINLQHLIYPVQQPVVANMLCPAPFFQEIDTSIYFSQIPFPVKIAISTGYGLWNTANIASVEVYPFQYYPALNQLTFYSNISLAIYYSYPAGSITQPEPIKMLAKYYNHFIRSLAPYIANANDILTTLTGIISIEQLEPDSPALSIHDFLVIIPGSFSSSPELNKYILWKKKRGIDIAIVKMEDIADIDDNIGNTITPANNHNIHDAAASLRMYLKSIHDQGGANWIVLLGDENKIPVRKITPYNLEYLGSIPPTDKYFADYTSDYEANGNGLYGEFSDDYFGNNGDHVDVFPEAYVGRIPCSSISELEIWINKLLTYETNPGNGNPHYLAQYVTTLADQFQDDQAQNSEILSNLNFFDTKVFQEKDITGSPNTTNPTQPTGEEIINYLIDKPSGWWTWGLHGNQSSILTMTSTSTGGGEISWINTSAGSNGLSRLNNATQPGIVHSGSCTVASFIGNSTCMADAYLFNPIGGGVALSGNTDLSWVEYEQAKLKNLSQVLKNCHEGNSNENTHMGCAEWMSNETAGYINSFAYETYLIHNLFGDPEMMYYTKEPTRLDAEVSPRHIDKTDPTNLGVTIKNLAFGHKVDVNLYQPGNLLLEEFPHKQEVTGENGNVTAFFNLPANLLTEGTLYVTISGFNYLPYIDDVLVSPGCSKQAAPNDKFIIATTPAFPWAGLKFINQDVIIKSPATLTITGEVYFVPEAKLIVEPGAKLIIDGGTLGASCEEIWKGVEVWGQYNKIQFAEFQGEINIINGGCIKEAACGILTAKGNFNGYDVYSTGGIVKCNGAVFLNNKIAVNFHPYQYLHWPNQGYFRNTEFTWNNKYLLPINPQIGDYPFAMAKLQSINYLSFEKCKFKNQMDITQFDSRRGYAIYAGNANFGITDYSNILNSSWVEGFYYGVYNICSGYLTSCNIEYTDFTNNLRGVYLNTGFAKASILRNTFKTRQATQILPSSAIYINGCTGYSVQENAIEGNFAGGALTYETGIVINNSLEAPNEIYNNTFMNLQNGITAQDDNRGLVCKCNDYDNVKFDQSALVSGTPGSLGIAPMQGASGSVTSPAGNTFSPQHATLQIPESDLKNQGAGFQYFHHVLNTTYRVIPEYYSSSIGRQNTGWGYDKSTACPSRLNGGGGGTPIESSVERLVQQQVLIDSLETALDELVDGGNTEETAADIVFSNPKEALDIYNDLLSKSPYLSDTVMTEAVTKEEVLSNPLLHEILVANPQSATNEGVLDQLDKRVDPMPEDLYIEILEGENILAPLTAEKASIVALKTDNATLYYLLMNRYLSDTSQYATDSLLYLFDVQNTAEAAYLQAFIQLNNGDFAAMNSTLSGISSEFDLSDEEQLLHGYYQQIFTLLQQMQTDTLPDLQADSLTIAQLQILVEDAPDPVKSYSRNILVANNAIEYHEPYLYDDDLKSSGIGKKHRMGALTKQLLLQVFPNPAKEYIIIRYNLANEISATQEKAVLEMVTTTGQVIKSLTLQAVTGQLVVSTKTFVPGVYIIHIKGINNKVETTKFTVVH